MRIRTSVLLALAAVALSAASATASEWRLELDPEQTTISFELGATLHSVYGTARLGEGVVIFDPDTGEVSGRITADASSADTENERRDRDMHGKVLESDEHPEIAFTPRTMRGELALEGESRVELDGRFAIHGGEHELTATAVVRISGDRLEADVEFEVPYVAWGMKNPSKLLLKVAKVVQVRVEGVGSLAPVEVRAADEPGVD